MKLKKNHIWLAIMAIAAGAAGFFLFLHSFDKVRQIENAPVGAGIEKEESRKETKYLYFGSREDTCLKAEPRVLEVPDTASEFGRLILEELVRGPEKELLPTIPENTEVSGFYVGEDKTGYADFSGEITRNHPGGTAAELLTIYSIVNSLTLNVDGIEKVKILIDGREASTLAGHVDLRAPFEPDKMFIR